MRFGIAAKISLLATCLVIVTAISVGWVHHESTEEILVGQELGRLSQELELEGLRVGRAIERLGDEVRFLARAPDLLLVAAARENRGEVSLNALQERLAEQFRKFMDAKPGYIQTRFVALDGVEVVRVDRNESNKLTTIKTLKQKGKYRYVKESLTLKPGEVYCSKINFNREHGKRTKKPVLRVAVPVYNLDREGNPNTVIGLVAVNMDFRSLTGRRRAFKEDGSEEVMRTFFVTDERGYYLHNPDAPERTFGFDKRHLVESERPSYLIQTRFPSLAPYFDANEKEMSQALLCGAAHDRHAIVLSKLRFDSRKPERFISLVHAMSHDAITQLTEPSRKERTRSLSLTAILAFAATFFALVVSRILTRSLKQITRATRNFGVASLQTESALPLEAKDEIGALARTFREMQDRIRERDEQQVAYQKEIKAEKEHADELLRVILPEKIVEELKATNKVEPKRHEKTAVLFCDIAGFTAFCEQHSPEEVVSHLQEIYEAFEELALKYDLEKIKTIGDSFMAAGGLIIPLENPALNCVQCGLDMVETAPQLSAGWTVRVAVHSGPVVAGVVGRRKYAYDLWGDTVNTSARVEGMAEAGQLWVSADAWGEISDHFNGETKGFFEVKGKGKLEMFSVTRKESTIHGRI